MSSWKRSKLKRRRQERMGNFAENAWAVQDGEFEHVGRSSAVVPACIDADAGIGNFTRSLTR
jgi:hypothetical protein